MKGKGQDGKKEEREKKTGNLLKDIVLNQNKLHFKIGTSCYAHQHFHLTLTCHIMLKMSFTTMKLRQIIS